MAKPIKTLELHYQMIQFSIIVNIPILVLVYVECGSLIVLRRGVFESLHAAKTALGSAG